MRLIDADALIAEYCDGCKYPAKGLCDHDFCGLAIMIKDAPTVDTGPVRHGRWVWKHRHHGGFRKYTGVDEFGETHTITVDERSECDEPYCPYCGKWNESVFRNYCPNCGAKMDGDAHEPR